MSASTLLRAVYELWADPERRVVRIHTSAVRVPGPGGEWKVSLWRRAPRGGQTAAHWCLRIVGPKHGQAYWSYRALAHALLG